MINQPRYGVREKGRGSATGVSRIMKNLLEHEQHQPRGCVGSDVSHRCVVRIEMSFVSERRFEGSWCYWFFFFCIQTAFSYSYQDALNEFHSQIFIPNMKPIVTRYLSPLFTTNEEDPLNPFARFQCLNLFQKQIHDFQNYTKIWPPPRNIPSEYHQEFTFFEQFPVFDQYFADEIPIMKLEWTHEMIESFISRESTCGPYQSHICEQLAADYHHLIQGKRGLILGSISPWAEALLFRYGASELITVEYTSITTSYPNLTVMTPAQLADLYLKGLWEPVDFIFSFSSIEHDGLGRYGDPINPWGDLETMARLHCLVKDDGYMFLGVPSGRDTLVWNAHRIYGRYRLRILFQDWWILRDCSSSASREDEGRDFTILLYSEDSINKSYLQYETIWILQKNKIPS